MPYRGWVSTSRDDAPSQHEVHMLDVDRGRETEIQSTESIC